jgi:pyruvate formate lyase activating enzyme
MNPERSSVDASPARFWTALPGGRVRCDLCPHHCVLSGNERGRCFLRRAEGGRLLTLAGRTSGFTVDPIEKKPLYHFLPGSRTLSFGTLGCNLSCRFCQNASLSHPEDESALRPAPAPEAIAEAAARSGCASVSFTYNEPVISIEFTLEVAAACRARGLRTVAVTAGYVAEAPGLEFFRAMDAANVDLKAFSDDFYRRLCGARLQPVLDTLERIRGETDCWLELTTLLIPGENDGEDELDRMCRWVAGQLGPDVPMHFSAFHPAFRFRDRPPTHPEIPRRARHLAMERGVRYAYTGNIEDRDGQRTVCPACGATVVEREGFLDARARFRSGGVCPDCGFAMAGHWDPSARRPTASPN